MPTDLPRALAFLIGFWLALALIGPLGAPRPSHAEAGELCEATDALEAQLYESVNRTRAEHHLIALRRDPVLDRAARAHSVDMATRRYLAHENPEGANPVDRIRAAGATDFRLVGENIGMTSRANPNEQIVQGWLASPVHRDNLLAPAFNATGVGVARAADGTLYYTQVYVNGSQ